MTTSATTTVAATDDDELVVSAALKRLRADGWTLDQLAHVWPSLSLEALADLMQRRNPWRPFTATMKTQYSRLLRIAQTHEHLVRLEAAPVEVRTTPDHVGNVVSLADYRVRKGS